MVRCCTRNWILNRNGGVAAWTTDRPITVMGIEIDVDQLVARTTTKSIITMDIEIDADQVVTRTTVKPITSTDTLKKKQAVGRQHDQKRTIEPALQHKTYGRGQKCSCIDGLQTRTSNSVLSDVVGLGNYNLDKRLDIRR
jgi:hypothetical protein